VIGANGTLGRWEYAAGLSYSRNDVSNTFTRGHVSLSRLLDALATGLVNPFGPSGPEGDALLASTEFRGEASSAKGTTYGVDAKATTELYRLPGGMMATAVGLEARRESFDFRFVDAVTSGDIIGIDVAAKPIAGDRTVRALFGELSVPFAPGVEAQFAARYDHYSDFGGTVQPKVALRWQPVRGLLLRTSWGTGFRAPTLYDMHEPQLRTPVLFFEDPARCPVTGAESDCFLASAVVGGNPDLQPETSTQVNAGVVWEPTPGLSLAIDYWNISKRDFIGQLNQVIIAENFARFESTNIIRGPVDPAFPTLPGPIDTVVLTWQNLGRLETSGLDVDLQWRAPASALGRFKLSLNGSYIIEWKWQPDGINWESAVGKNILGPLPRWRHVLSLDWDAGPWGATLSQRFQSGYEDVNFFPPRLSSPPEPRDVSSYSVWDLQARYSGRRNTSIAVGVRNLADRDPPASNQPFTSQLGYDPTYGDPRGRTYYARLVYAFK
jgi:iron complex outermembrane receptor protein